MRIKDLPSVDRPRERLIAKGSEYLKDSELLAILLRTGVKGMNAVEIASQILKKVSKKRLLQMTYGDLIAIKGVNSAKAVTLLAAFELSKRLLDVDDVTLPEIITAKDAVDQLADLRNLKKEHFVALFINARNKLVQRELISIGSLNEGLAHPREVFEPAIKNNAAYVIIGHNHPSGDPAPSPEDIQVTKRLCDAGEVLGISLLDHIIVAAHKYLSFREERLL